MLRMKASPELFIVKTTLLQNGCPAPHCPDAEWRHEELPRQCILWWRETGWRLMGWHGSPANVDSGAIKERIREFRKKFKQRNRNSRSTAEVADISSPPLASTPKQQPIKESTHSKVLQDVSQVEHGSQAFKTFPEDSQPATRKSPLSTPAEQRQQGQDVGSNLTGDCSYHLI